ncbi:MAG: hypothetical protein IJ343_06150 [Clostridia bacterium]|nr:hypothetical protein [Clostridia bacterium]
MRKLTLLLTLLLTLSLLNGCTPQPDLMGRWETSPEETLCATLLFLNGDRSFTHHQEGRNLVGTWGLHGNTLTLTHDGGAFTYTLDRENGRLDMGSGLHLYRQPDPDIVGWWVSTEDDIPGHTSLLLMASGCFTQEISHTDEIDPTVLDGSDRMYGDWLLEGRLLTLRCRDKTVLRYHLSTDGTVITTDSGVQLINFRIPD